MEVECSRAAEYPQTGSGADTWPKPSKPQKPKPQARNQILRPNPPWTLVLEPKPQVVFGRGEYMIVYLCGDTDTKVHEIT